jgi:hypothetical protein
MYYCKLVIEYKGTGQITSCVGWQINNSWRFCVQVPRVGTSSGKKILKFEDEIGEANEISKNRDGAG